MLMVVEYGEKIIILKAKELPLDLAYLCIIRDLKYSSIFDHIVLVHNRVLFKYHLSSLFSTIYMYYKMIHSLDNSNKHGNSHQNSETSCVFYIKIRMCHTEMDYRNYP